MNRILAVFLLFPMVAFAQEPPDSARMLEPVTVRAYEYNRAILSLPSSVTVVGPAEFQRFPGVSLLPIVNTAAGVRMEERSPGSYRFSIRGSTLRSPFGVRNVKLYWNELPLTDPGGNTYLNQLDPLAIQRAEIIRGPGSSLYGSGTGGVVLFSSPAPEDGFTLSAGALAGSFGLLGYNAGFQAGSTNSRHNVQYFHQQAEGYREQSGMVRDMINSTFRFDLNEGQSLETVLLYSDLYYQTPGGLTKSEMDTDPRQARPTTGVPSAVDQQAHVSLQSFYAGVLHGYRFGERLNNRTGAYGNFVQFANAALRNYERRAEQNLGVRSVTSYSLPMRGGTTLEWIGGLEFQHGFSPITTYQNLSGAAGTILTNDEVTTNQFNLFGQADILAGPWTVTAGLGVNWVGYRFERFSLQPVQPSLSEEKRYTPFVAPRVAVSRSVGEGHVIYANVSRGFSPPTIQEVYPSTNQFNSTLQPEVGTQFETGFRGSMRQFQYELALYHFNLDETIVVRRDPDGADYFVNAGGTRQDGVELTFSWKTVPGTGVFRSAGLWASASLQYYYFSDYMKDTVSYSDNRMTGVPQQMVNGGVEVSIGKGGYVRLNANYTGDLPLDDGNTVFADAYLLIGGRMGWKVRWKEHDIELFLAGDNLLDEQYSLGHDLNAAGGRYYNPASARALSIGLNLLHTPTKATKRK